MDVANEAEHKFLEYLEANLTFWRSQKPRAGDDDKVIVVDLYHDNSEYLRLNLITAKYLQYRFGGTIVGVTLQSAPSHAIIKAANRQNLQRIAHSFGIEEIVTIEVAEEEGRSRRNDFWTGLSADNPAALRCALLNYVSPRGVPLTRYAYENYLKSQFQETVRELDAELIFSVNEAFAVEEFFTDFFRKRKCSWVVSGHIVYNFWGVMSHMALLSGVPVMHTHPLTPELMYIFRDKPQHAMPIQSLCRAADKKVFDEFLWPHREKLRRATLAMAQGAELGFKAPNWWLKPAAASADKSQLRADVRTRFGWHDLSKPIVSVCAHTFADAPLGDLNAHDDYYRWIFETIALAQADTGKYWLFKRHPQDHLFNKTGASQTLYNGMVAADHIRAVGEELTREELFAATDLAITIRGSLGYDLPAHGVPCLLAGCAPYSELGFCIVADTLPVYISFLRDLGAIPALSDEQIYRAQMYFALNQLFGGLNSVHILGRDARNGPVAYWNDLLRSVELYSVEQDPYYRNICDSLTAGSPRGLNFDLIRFLVAE